jgi:hypothetical protein
MNSGDTGVGVSEQLQVVDGSFGQLGGVVSQVMGVFGMLKRLQRVDPVETSGSLAVYFPPLESFVGDLLQDVVQFVDIVGVWWQASPPASRSR